MSGRIILLSCISVVMLVVAAGATPQGCITCVADVDDGAYRVYEANAASGAVRTVVESTTAFGGVDAAPYLGDPCVIQRAGADPTVSDIVLLDGKGGTTTVKTGSASLNATDPLRSFDGRTLGYVQYNGGVSNEDALHIIAPDGSGDTTVYTTPADRDVDIQRPRLSPDGGTFVFALDDHFWESRDIYAISASGGDFRELEDLPENAQHPAYSADGKMLACVAPVPPGGTVQLYVSNADGSSPRQVTFDPEFALFPSFSPDNKYIVAGSYDGLIVVDLSNDTIIQRIPLNYSNYYGICWHLGAHADGAIKKVKAKSGKLSVKVTGFAPGSAPQSGFLRVDNTIIPFDNSALWEDKNGKKYKYKDKANGRKASITVKKEKGAFSAKKLNLVAGTDYAWALVYPWL